MDRARVADPFELFFLQDAQQLDLQLVAHAGDFIEKDGAAVGRLEPAGLVVDGPGEGPLDVAEQLAFQQAFAQGPAVDAHIGAVGAGAELVDVAGDDFLAGARFADEQHAGPRVGHLPGQTINGAHGGTVADHPRQGGVERFLRDRWICHACSLYYPNHKSEIRTSKQLFRLAATRSGAGNAINRAATPPAPQAAASVDCAGRAAADRFRAAPGIHPA